MKYQYKLSVKADGINKDFYLLKDLETVKLGTTTGCKFRLDKELFQEEINIQFEYRNNQWVMVCPNNLKIDGTVSQELSLIDKDIVKICSTNTEDVIMTISFGIDFDDKVNHYNSFMRLSSDRKIIIGDIESADLKVTTDFIEKDNVVLKWSENSLSIVSRTSNLDILVNEKTAQDGTFIDDKSFIRLVDFVCYYSDGKLYFDDRNVEVRTEGVESIIKNKDFKYPLFVRNTRKRIKVNNEPISILNPPDEPVKPDLNLVNVLMPVLAMFALVVVMKLFMSDMGGTFIIFTVCSMSLGVLTSAASLVVSRKQYHKDCKTRKEDYSIYSRRKEEEIIRCRNEEIDNLNEMYYSIEDDVNNFKNFDSNLFDRIPTDEDFLDVYLGKGRIKSKRQVDYKEQEKINLQDNISQIPADLALQYKYINDAPIVSEFRGANAIGVVGPDSRNNIILENMIIDLMARHYYGDVKLYLLLDKEDIGKFSWLRMLPYFKNALGFRNIVVDNDSKNYIFESLYKELSYRASAENVSGHNVVFVKKEHGIKSHPISKFIEKAGALNTTFVFFEEKEELLPLYCSQIIRLDETNSGYIFRSDDKTNISEFQYVQVSEAAKKMLSERIPPIKCEEISLDGTLRKSITLFELLDVYEADDLDLRERYNSTKIYESMAVPLGVNVKDEIVYLDLHEKYHGPHGLVAGTTGSGKSEILQSYILGAASLFQPSEIGFLIIDFKGGGMVNQFKNLPHLLGAITNIDGKAIDRSLKSIKAELLKRQELFAGAEVNHIDKYIRLYKEGKVDTALPHLVIIVDEFAELKAEQPEFMKELISAARIGRSLGVHLILATQKPAGQVDDQIWSNSKFKLCLKVQTPEDSNEVLKSPLAAEIKEPGRAYLQVGNNEIFELFQSGFSGAPEKMDLSKKSFDLSEVDFVGNKNIIFNQKSKTNTTSKTQLEAMVDYIDGFCNDNNIETLDSICLPQLDTVILDDNTEYEREEEVSCPIGIYDDPSRQYQGVTSLNIESQNTIIIGATQYGKTNILSVLIKNLSRIYTPKELNIYVFDFASMVLKNFENLKHVGGVVVPSEEEKVKNLFKFLNEEVEKRREILLSVGVSSFSSYKEAGYDDLTQIVVMIDNFTILREMYLTENDELITLTREGLSVGITFIIANNNTTGFGFKYLSNFAGRIALYCNDNGEYSALFGRGNVYPDEIPGRALIEINKEIFECQMFLAFEGEKEIERVANMRDYVEYSNSKCDEHRAKPIPEIPELLNASNVMTYYDNGIANEITIGLNYETVDVEKLDIRKNNLISILGREKSGKTNAFKYIMSTLCNKNEDARVYVFDDYRKKLNDIAEELDSEYETMPDKICEVVSDIYDLMTNRYNLMVTGEEYQNELVMLVINNPDTAVMLSNDMTAMNKLKEICGKFKPLNVAVIVGQVPNESLGFNSPELYRYIKENTNVIFFDELDRCKLFDLPMSVLRNKNKRLSIGDGYYFIGNEVHRIKTPLKD